MAVVALVSAKGSPGTTTAAMAFMATWSRPVIFAETDPAGGDLLAGFLRGELGANLGLAEVTVAALRGRLSEEFFSQLVDVDRDKRRRLLLPGITSPAQSATLAPVWPDLATYFASLEYTEPGYDVLADCGRLAAPNPPLPILQAADAVLIVVGGTLASVAHAAAAIPVLARQLVEAGGTTAGLGLLIRDGGTYPPKEIAKTLRARAKLHLPPIAALPDDRSAARVFSEGGQIPKSSPLLRAAAAARERLTALISASRQARVAQREVAHA